MLNLADGPLQIRTKKRCPLSLTQHYQINQICIFVIQGAFGGATSFEHLSGKCTLNPEVDCKANCKEERKEVEKDNKGTVIEFG